MTNILDSVEPDAFRYNKVRGLNKEPFGTEYSEAPPRQNPGLTEQCSSVDPLYSRETVERLLEAHRKQIAEEFAVAAWTVGMNEHNKALGMPCDAREVGSAVARELRRMAEGAK